MSRFFNSRPALGVAFTLAMILVTPAQAQDETQKSWAFTSEFSGVWTGGNSESRTFGLDASFTYTLPRSVLHFKGGSVRSEASRKTRTAVGTSTEDFDVTEEKTTEKTSESYYLRGRYDYTLSARFTAFAGADWFRNTFAGIDSRLLFAAGAGNTWIQEDHVRFKTDYSATYTFQEDVVRNPFVKTNFPGVRASYDLWWKLTESTEFASVLIGDWNLDNTDDIRFDLTNELPISISSVLAFKPSLQLLWRNDPSLTELQLTRPDGSPTGDTVLAPLEKLDAIFKVALVLRL